MSKAGVVILAVKLESPERDNPFLPEDEIKDPIDPKDQNGQLRHLHRDEERQEEREEEWHYCYPRICPRNPLIKFVRTTAATPSTAAPVQLTTPALV